MLESDDERSMCCKQVTLNAQLNLSLIFDISKHSLQKDMKRIYRRSLSSQIKTKLCAGLLVAKNKIPLHTFKKCIYISFEGKQCIHLLKVFLWQQKS